jgi:hypothetical protein
MEEQNDNNNNKTISSGDQFVEITWSAKGIIKAGGWLLKTKDIYKIDLIKTPNEKASETQCRIIINMKHVKDPLHIEFEQVKRCIETFNILATIKK